MRCSMRMSDEELATLKQLSKNLLQDL